MMQKSRVQRRRKSVAKMVNAAFASWPSLNGVANSGANAVS